ncbi:MAG: hypothetical protein EOM72_10135 [Opitutae bacterium]|nr:hypothetical protein [Opitutae bacterium]
MNIREELIRAVDALNAAGIPYAICGGLAVVIHGYPRLTDDIDLLVLPSDVARCKTALRDAGFGYANPEPMAFHAGQANHCIVHRVVHFEGEDYLVLDLIEMDDSLQAVWKGRQTYRWEGRDIFVVSRHGLLQMKKAAARPQDLADIDHLQLGEGDADG